MPVYAIGDLHLPGSGVKSMDIFGTNWENHFARICEDWRARVREDDIVLLPGDLSWAMTMRDVQPDLAALAALPGKKVLLRGNHDFWWSSVSQVRSALPEGMYALQNDCTLLGGIAFVGTRGWILPSGDKSTGEEKAQNLKLYHRELIRLEMSLKSAKRAADEKPLVAMLHFPPFDEHRQLSGFTELLEKYGVKHAVYGHLHGQALKYAFSGTINGVAYYPVSCDGLSFRLLQLPV